MSIAVDFRTPMMAKVLIVDKLFNLAPSPAILQVAIFSSDLWGFKL